ncbi:MAG: hypothetical protein ACYTHM_20840, partial [Planctomycetota bacterium]
MCSELPDSQPSDDPSPFPGEETVDPASVPQPANRSRGAITSFLRSTSGIRGDISLPSDDMPHDS